MALKSTVISKKLLSPVSDNITMDFVFVYDIMLVFTVSLACCMLGVFLSFFVDG